MASEREGLAWQIGVWNRISDVYAHEIDRRFVPVVDAIIATLGFDFDDFETAWDILAGVTTDQLSPDLQKEAKEAVMAAMWPRGEGSRHFQNVTQFIIGHAVD